MLLLFIFVSSIAQGSIIARSANENSLCDKSVPEGCKLERTDKVPETAEEIDALCNNLVPYHDCMTDFLTSCDIDEDVVPQRGLFHSGVIPTICDKDSLYYTLLVENVKCMGDAMKEIENTRNCGDYLEELTPETPDIQKRFEELFTGKDDEETTQLERCLNQVFEVGCIATSFNRKCGEDAVQLLLMVVEKSGMVEHSCKEQHASTIEKLAELMKWDFKK